MTGRATILATALAAAVLLGVSGLAQQEATQDEQLGIVLAEMQTARSGIELIYQNLLVLSASGASADQALLVDLEWQAAQIEMRAAAMLLRTFELRYLGASPGRPFRYSVEVAVLEIKLIFQEIIARSVEIETILIRVVVKPE
ncbi:MAG: hypothetical protein PHU43_07345 [Candidatus Bipolaricaulis sp.]|nr:hypothetical protein [Candidatus Bipolaricaulis sp.]